MMEIFLYHLCYFVLQACFTALEQCQALTHVTLHDLCMFALSPLDGEEALEGQKAPMSRIPLSTNDQK